MEANNTGSELPPAVRLFLMVNGGLYLTCLAVKAFCTRVLHLGTPYNQYFLGERFPDFFTVRAGFEYFHHVEFFTKFHLAYPAPPAVFYEFFVLFGRYAFPVFMGFIVLALAIAALFFCKALVQRGMQFSSVGLLVGLTALFAFPIHFEWNQANIEIIVWCLLSGAVVAFLKERPYLAAALIGVAAAMKIFPFVYLGLLLSKRHYKPVAFAILIAAVTTIVSLWLVYPDVSYSWTQSNGNMASLREHYILHLRTESAFDHSWFAAVKSVTYVTKHLLHPPSNFFAPYLRAYMITVALSGLVLYFLRIRLLPVTNQVLTLCIAAIAMPPLSFDYTLMHLYVPWAMLICIALAAWKQKMRVPGLSTAFALLGILFALESELIFRGVRVGGQLKAVSLMVLFVVALCYRFEHEDFDTCAKAT